MICNEKVEVKGSIVEWSREVRNGEEGRGKCTAVVKKLLNNIIGERRRTNYKSYPKCMMHVVEYQRDVKSMYVHHVPHYHAIIEVSSIWNLGLVCIGLWISVLLLYTCLFDATYCLRHSSTNNIVVQVEQLFPSLVDSACKQFTLNVIKNISHKRV